MCPTTEQQIGEPRLSPEQLQGLCQFLGYSLVDSEGGMQRVEPEVFVHGNNTLREEGVLCRSTTVKRSPVSKACVHFGEEEDSYF